MTNEKVLWKILSVSLQEDCKTVHLHLEGRSLTFSNMTTCSSTVSLSLEEMLKHGLSKGKSFFGTSFYRDRSFSHSTYHFDQHPSSQDHETADDMQNSVTREICRQHRENK